MTQHRDQISNKDVHAYVDGHLDEDKKKLVESMMQEDVMLRETIESYRLQNDLFHQAYDPILEQAIPDSFTISGNVQSANRPWWINLVASITLLMGGGFLGWSAHSVQMAKQSVIQNLAQPATIAHVVYSPEVRHPVEVGVEQEQHLVKWLSKRMGKTIKTPQLTEAGFNLIGGRLLPSENGPAAQFMYEDNKGERLTLYVRNKNVSEQNTAFRFYQQNGTNAFYWIDGNLGYVLSGAVNKEQLLRTATSVYHQLSF